jgi:putative membrane protein
MKKLAFLPALIIPLIGCAFAAEQSGTNQPNSSTTGDPSMSAGSNQKSSSTSASMPKGQLSAKDMEFVKKAASGGMMEVHMGQMAEKQGQSAEVKEIGRRMVQDHTNANQRLMALAQSKGLKLPKEKMDHKMGGANFDKEYLTMMVSDHEKDVAEFETEAKSGDDVDVKGFAKQTLPTLKEHLKMVKAAQAKMK